MDKAKLLHDLEAIHKFFESEENRLAYMYYERAII